MVLDEPVAIGGGGRFDNTRLVVLAAVGDAGGHGAQLQGRGHGISLADGKHTFTVKAWDVNDNTGQGTVNFTVVDGNVMDVQQLSNYPNPFNNTTTFVFEHNHPFEDLNVEVDIFSTSGAAVKSIKQDFTASDSRTTEITWDGTDNHGGRLPSGVYVYRMSVTSDKGFKTAAYQKLVIVR